MSFKKILVIAVCLLNLFITFNVLYVYKFNYMLFKFICHVLHVPITP